METAYTQKIHLRNILDALQGRDRKEVPQKIIEDVLRNVNKDMADLTVDDVYRCLVKLRYSTYWYRYTPVIYRYLTGRPIPQLSIDERLFVDSWNDVEKFPYVWKLEQIIQMHSSSHL